jgi:hypothetical protein
MERGSDSICSPNPHAGRATFAGPSLLDPRFDHDSCGTGFVAQISGEASD